MTVDAAAAITAPYVSAMVEIDGGGGLVEQRAVHPAGETVGVSVAPCTTDTAEAWYLAEGFTAGGSVEQLVLTNPSDQVAIVDVGFATASGSREPQNLQGMPVPARSVQVIDMASIAARDEAEVAVKVEATFGELVVGRGQVYMSGGRLGYGMALAAPALRSQWWFANGDKGPGVTERYSLYNPTENDVEVQPTFLGIADGTDLIDPDRRTGPPGRDVHVRRRDEPRGRSPCRGVRHHRLLAVDRRGAGRHPHDRGRPDDVGGARRGVPPGGRPRGQHLDDGHRSRRADRGRAGRLQHRRRRRRRHGASGDACRDRHGAVLGRDRPALRRADHHPPRRAGRGGQPADHPLDVARVRRALAAPGARRRRARSGRGPCRRPAEPPWTGC